MKAPVSTPAVARAEGWVQIASVVVYHLVPVVSAISSNAAVARFLLLCLFNVVFGIMSGFCANVVVTLLQTPARPSASHWGRIQPWVSLALVAVSVSVLLALLFGWLVIVMLPNATRALADRQLWLSAAVMVAVALPRLVTRGAADLRARASEDARVARDRPAVLLQVASGFAMLILTSYAVSWLGDYWLYPLMVVLTGFFIFRDLRPDVILRELFPDYGR
jgi:hypothetical protein